MYYGLENRKSKTERRKIHEFIHLNFLYLSMKYQKVLTRMDQ